MGTHNRCSPNLAQPHAGVKNPHVLNSVVTGHQRMFRAPDDGRRQVGFAVIMEASSFDFSGNVELWQ